MEKECLEAPRNQNLPAAFIGMGKVGTALACALHDADYPIAAVYDIRPSAMDRAATHTGARRCRSAAEAAGLADVIFLTTPDDAIESACRNLAEEGILCRGKRVLHVSGSAGLDLLDAARRSGAVVGCIHPLQSFPDIDSAILSLPGSAFGLTLDDDLKEWATSLVAALGGFPIFLSDRDKPLYHAAACMASNYLVALSDAVRRLYRSFGLTDDEALKASRPLIAGTLRNIERKGTVSALSGPIERGDAGTVKRHLAALALSCPDLLPVYRHLGLLTVDVAARKNSADLERLDIIKEMLCKE